MNIKSIIKKGEYLPIMYDRLFKKVFGDNNYLERLCALLSIILNVPVSYFKGNIKIVNNEKVLNHFNDKQEYLDVVIEVSENDRVKEKINIEINYSNKAIKRNLLYAFGSIGNTLKVVENYNNVPKYIQINFDNYNAVKKNPKPIKRCYIKDEEGNIVDECICIYYIDVAKCYELCYNEDIKEYCKNEQNIIRLAGLMKEKNRKKFKKIMELIDMEEEVKQSITKAVDEYSSEVENWYVYDNDREIRATRAAELEDATNNGLKQGIKQGKLEIAKNMLNENIPIDMIIKITKLSKEEIENIDNKS